MNTDTFSLKRLSTLIINDIKLHAKLIVITIVTLAVLITLIPGAANSAVLYFMLLYIGGFIITSMAFSDIQDPRKTTAYLMLPASALEKFLSKWLLTSIIYAIAILIFCYLFLTLITPINLLLYKRHTHPLDIFQFSVWFSIGKYIILQAVVLLGAISFRKYVLVKTALTLGCVLLIITLLFALIVWVVSPLHFQGEMTALIMLQGWYFLFWIALAPICWYLTYLKLKNYELQ